MQASTLITPRLAEEAIYSRLTCLPIESLPLTQCVGGTLRENIYAERDHPPFDRVTMDGIAVDSEALRRGQRRFRIQGTQAAGAPRSSFGRSEDAIEVMTGAILPPGSDCVIPVEQFDVVDGIASLNSTVVSAPYHNVHRRGSDSRQGRLLARSRYAAARAGNCGCRLGRHGTRAREQPTGGHGRLHRRRIDRAGRSRSRTIQVRRSNAYAVAATLRKRGFGRVGDDHVPDDEDLLHERLALHLTTHEVVILSGGVSMGKFDLVPKVLMQLGVQRSVSQHCTAAGQTHVVRHRSAGSGGIWFARQSGLHARVPDPLCDSGHCRGDGHAARAARALGACLAGNLQARARRISCRSPSNTTIGAVPGPIRGRPMARETS